MITAVEVEPVIGLEVHAQLLTASKMFCTCSARYWDAPPNVHVCPVDLGLPGALPVINQEAINSAIKVALALHCRIAEVTRFDRKNYHYPDLPKGYQISQYDMPLGTDGYLEFDCNGQHQRVGIIRVHVEEDTGKSIHAVLDGREVSLIDYNRSGVPLMEIVSAPELHSPEAARQYFAKLRQILVYLGVSSGNMEQGVLRADINVSLRRPDGSLGIKTEIKNLNSFRSVYRALEYEIARQRDLLAAGQELVQETRGWDETRGITVPQRSKEYAEDYRYFPEPDLPPLYLLPDHIARLKEQLPELAEEKRDRFMRDYGLSRYDAEVLTQERALADLFEETVRLAPFSDPKTISNWLTGEFLRLLNETGTAIEESYVTPEKLADMLKLLAAGTITTAIGKTVFEELFRTGRTPSAIVAERGLTQISDRTELAVIVDRILAENPKLVADYPKAEGPLVGKVMGATRGKANAQIVKELIRERLAK